MKTPIIFSMILVLGSSIACEKKVTAPNTQIVSVKNGTVIGNINLSDFRHEVEVKSTTENYQVQNRSGTVLKSCSDTENSSDWNSILSKIDFAAFKQLPAIDCPNCPALGDIGYEYLEIQSETESYRVSFATGADVKEVSDLLKIVRAKRNSFDKTCQ